MFLRVYKVEFFMNGVLFVLKLYWVKSFFIFIFISFNIFLSEVLVLLMKIIIFLILICLVRRMCFFVCGIVLFVVVIISMYLFIWVVFGRKIIDYFGVFGIIIVIVGDKIRNKIIISLNKSFFFFFKWLLKLKIYFVNFRI